MPSLVITGGYESGARFTLAEGDNLIGRGQDCRIRLSDPWISRSHAAIVLKEGKASLRDLNSHNGTQLNGRKSTAGVLCNGDTILFGKTPARYFSDEVEEDDLVSRSSFLGSSDTVLRDIKELQSELVSPDAEGAAAWRGGRRRELKLLNEIGKLLTKGLDLSSMLVSAIDLVNSTVSADHGHILLFDSIGDLRTAVSRQNGKPGPKEARVSRTIIDAALGERVAILTTNAMADLRFKKSRSVIAHSISSCICAPLWLEDRVLGAIVVDTTAIERKLTEEDLDILTAVGYQIALSIEQFRLRDRVKEEHQKRIALLRHFSPDVARLLTSHSELETDPLQVGLHDVTVLFADLQGFTSIAENLSPLSMAELLNGYFKLMTEAIFREDGTLDKFIGDGVMAVFGVPYSHDDDPIRAVRCAIRMYHELEEYNQGLPPDMNLRMRIGINTGQVVAGNFGSLERVEYTVLGDAVNVASRLQSMAATGTILIGPTTFSKTRGRFFFLPHGSKPIKGKSSGIEVYEVLQKLPEDMSGVLH